MTPHLSLNLLPPDRKHALRTGYVFAYAQTMLILFFVLAAIGTGTIFSVKLLVAATHDDLASRAMSTTDEFKGLAADIKDMNAYLTRTAAFNKRLTPWSDVLRRISDQVPAGTVLSRITVATDGKITVSGVADTRADVLSFGDRLRADATFTDVRSPLSNILQQRDVKFDFELRLAGAEPAPKR